MFVSHLDRRPRYLGVVSPVERGSPWRSATRTTLLLVGVLGAGIALALAVVNRRTNVGPPTRDPSGELGVETPNLEGPDALDLAPLVAVAATGFAFDHEPVDGAGLEHRLQTYKANFPLLHPGEPAPREILLACSPNIASERVFAVLETARLMGFDRARLVFETMGGQEQTSVRKPPPRVTAARVSIGTDTAPQGAERLLRSSDIENCSQLSERVIALRREGLPVTIVTK